MLCVCAWAYTAFYGAYMVRLTDRHINYRYIYVNLAYKAFKDGLKRLYAVNV